MAKGEMNVVCSPIALSHETNAVATHATGLIKLSRKRIQPS
jgi:hypothetical protein